MNRQKEICCAICIDNPAAYLRARQIEENVANDYSTVYRSIVICI